MSRAGRDNRGFSLLELLVVLMLIGVASALVLPAVESGLTQRQMRQAALALAAAARRLRSAALYENMPQQLIVDPHERSYQASGDVKTVLSAPLAFTRIEGGEPSGDGLRRFIFFPNGSVLGGEIEISAREGLHYLVRLEPLSGRVMVMRDRSE